MFNFRREIKKIPFVHNIGIWIKSISKKSKEGKAYYRDITEFRMSMLKQNSQEYLDEIEYILENLNHQEEWFIPYPSISHVGNVESGYDKKWGLPYVIHEGKKLYFPSSYDEKTCEAAYRVYVEKECLLGGRYRLKQPHQYESHNCMVEKGDTLVDVGCAEALFALENIDKASKVYLFEGESKWFSPLRATFNAYMDKVVIINKYISDKNTNSTVRLDTALAEAGGGNIFIKMDIEGAEKNVLECSKQFLMTKNHLKLSVCTYHRQEDGDKISALFNELGLQQEYSDGYIYSFNRIFKPVSPYFRHGVIRGWK